MSSPQDIGSAELPGSSSDDVRNITNNTTSLNKKAIASSQNRSETSSTTGKYFGKGDGSVNGHMSSLPQRSEKQGVRKYDTMPDPTSTPLLSTKPPSMRDTKRTLPIPAPASLVQIFNFKNVSEEKYISLRSTVLNLASASPIISSVGQNSGNMMADKSSKGVSSLKTQTHLAVNVYGQVSTDWSRTNSSNYRVLVNFEEDESSKSSKGVKQKLNETIAGMKGKL